MAKIPDFDLIRQVGQGGFGEVWLATNHTTGQLRAVKIVPLRRAGPADPASREIASLTRLEHCLARQHPDLLTIHHVGKTADCLFYVMDPADDSRGGEATAEADYQPATLQSRLESQNLSDDDCRKYAGQLLSGLASLHAAGMVHRDVKPANCLFVAGELKLADFGLVTEDDPLVSRLGTQKYMPPDGCMDARADVYAAGLVIYEMITGLPVDDFPSLGPQANRIRSSPSLTALLGLVLHACERDPQLRPADARAMLAELKSAEQWAHRSPRRRLLAALALLAAAAGGALALWLTGAPLEQRCDINFVTEPYEAKIYLDGLLQVDVDGKPYRTPCTVPDLPARTCQVEFEFDGEPRWNAGSYDLAETQQIVARQPSGGAKAARD